MENLQFHGDDGQGIDDFNHSNKSTISSSSCSFIFWNKALEEHFPSHFINKPLVNEFGNAIKSDIIDYESMDFSEKWANSYLQQLGYFNCLPLVQKYKTLTKRKEDLVELCVNKIEEKNEIIQIKNLMKTNKPQIKILIEEDNNDDGLSSHSSRISSLGSKIHSIQMESVCKICYANEEKTYVGVCLHSFCKECLAKYLENLISNGQA